MCSGSVTKWIAELKAGESRAPQALWQRYVEQLIRVAAHKLAHAPRRVADEEDVVNAAFASFLRGVDTGRFAQLEDRQDLWQLLCMLTERRAVDQMRRESTAAKGGGKVRGDSAFGDEEVTKLGGFAEVADPQPSPEFAVQVADELRRKMEELGDDELREIVIAKLEGYSCPEIASRLGLSKRTVERRLSLIRRIWREAGEG